MNIIGLHGDEFFDFDDKFELISSQKSEKHTVMRKGERL